MGYDYRGGNASGGDRAFASYLDDVKKGKTKGQINRDLMTRIITAGGQAAVGAIGHAAEGRQSLLKQQEQQNRQQMAGAIDSQSRQAAFEAQGRRDNAASGYADAGTHVENAHVNVPDWLSRQQDPEHSPEAINMSLSTDALNAGRANKSAELSAINGYLRPEGMDAISGTTGPVVQDQNTAEELAKYGGMNNSLQRSR